MMKLGGYVGAYIVQKSPPSSNFRVTAPPAGSPSPKRRVLQGISQNVNKPMGWHGTDSMSLNK